MQPSNPPPGETLVQKVISIVGVSKESFSKAADNAIRVAAKSVRNMKWARAREFEMSLEGDSLVDYRTTVQIYFDVE